MPRTRAFEDHAAAYDAWFEAHQGFYQSELAALRLFVPATGTGVEIGVGSGRFAQPLGITVGVEPSPAMRRIAQGRGVNTVDGTAEHLPLAPERFDFALFVTTLCFVDSLPATFAEVYRILKAGGCVIIGFVEKDSELGKKPLQGKNQSRFYRDARFHSTGDVVQQLRTAGFGDFAFAQTLFPGEDPARVQAVTEGHGQGGFVVVRAQKPVR